MAKATDPELAVTSEKLPGSQVSLAIEVPQATVEAAYDRVLNRLSQRVKIEGFRPGKAPRALIEARLGAATLRTEVIDVLVPVVVSQALTEQSIEPIDRPRVDVVELDRGRPGKLKATVSVMPEVKLPDLASLRVEKLVTSITEEAVTDRVDELRERLAEVEPVEREVRLGDIVVGDLEVISDGAPVESEARKGMEVEVREGVLIPELRHALPGRQIGEVAVADVTLPEEHSNEHLRGKPVQLRLTVQGVKEKKVPELTDELAGRLSSGEQTTVAGFLEAVRRDLQEQAERMDELAFEQAVLKAVVEGSRVEVSPAMIEREVEHMAEELERRLSRQGLRLEHYLAYSNLDPAQWQAQAQPEAEARLKTDFVLDQVARQEGIEPTDAEVEAYMDAEGGRDPGLSAQMQELRSSPAALDYFRHRLQRLRTLELLVERAQEAC